MRNKTRRLSIRTVATAVAITCISAFAVTATATADEWNELPSGAWTNNVKVEGNLTVSGQLYGWPMQSTTCSINTTAVIGSGGTLLVSDARPSSEYVCANGRKFDFYLDGWASSTTFDNYPPYFSVAFAPVGPGGYTTDVEYSVPLVNGTGGANTKLVFNNQRVGSGGLPLRVNGNLEIKNPAGGTYTVSP